MTPEENIYQTLQEVERSSNLKPPQCFFDQLLRFSKLVSTWNDYASLVSAGDLQQGLASHVIDSLTLVPHVLAEVNQGRNYLDIGSGCGFPAIPILIYCPDLACSMVERSARKTAFLRNVASELNLRCAVVQDGSFPDVELPEQPWIVTARAMIRPDSFLATLSTSLSPNCCFLRQTGSNPPPLPEGLVEERAIDSSTGTDSRRGELYKVRRSHE